MMESLSWPEAVKACHQRGQAYALATVLGCSGSTPRDPGSKMVITADSCFDSIGGGHLEFLVLEKARDCLARGEAVQEVMPFPLGGIGQCCGGNATVLLEVFPAVAFQIAVFGAGHVARALMPILGGLPCRVRWIDNRANSFPAHYPETVSAELSAEPEAQIADLLPGSDVLILTHDHQLDYRLTQAVLKRTDLRFVGLIGSKTKAARFRHRLLQSGFNEDDWARIHCPVGAPEVPGKQPMEVAVSIAAQLIALEHADRPKATRRGLAWSKIKRELAEGSKMPAGSDSPETNQP